jgi:hypothetical protein
VLVNTIGLAHAPFGSAGGEQKWISALQADARDGTLLVIGDRRTRWLDVGGREVRTRRHDKRLRRLQAVRFRPGEDWTIVGTTDALGRRLQLVPAAGGPTDLRLEGYGAVFANVVGDEEVEIVVQQQASLLVYDRRGQLLRTIVTGDYVTDMWPVEADGRGVSELLVYQYHSRKKGTTLVVLAADGSRLGAWHEDAANRYSVCAWPSPSPQVIAARDDVFTVRALTGEVLKRYVVTGAGSFRYVDTGELAGGFRLLLAHTGSCPSRLLVFDADDRLVYDEVIGEYATLLAPGPGSPVFYVATGGAIRKYARLEGAR